MTMRVEGLLRWAASLAVLAGGLASGAAQAQTAIDAQWVWAADAEAKQGAWFIKAAREDGPCTGQLRMAASGPFELWVNGTAVGEGEGGKAYNFLLSGIVQRGTNLIAIHVGPTADGPAGVLVDGEIRHQGGRSRPFDTPNGWLVTTQAPAGDEWKDAEFDAAGAGFVAVTVLGKHADSPWKTIEFPTSYLDRFSLAQGLELKRVAEPGLVGSLVAFTWGNRGRLIASRERGPILSVIDDDEDGVYDRVVEYTNEVTNCQGLCVVGPTLYAVGSGQGSGAALFALPDLDGDDRADEVVKLMEYRGGMAEHGPHAVVLGPDGQLYQAIGNHAGVPESPQPNSPTVRYYEGDLLQPRFEDARGHARGIKAPGGQVYRFSPDGKKWWLHTSGFRNHYDIAFAQNGELFTFDSDMEWDVGQPWYRPVRVNHCVPGGEFGWRSGAAKWPDYYFDSLPAAVDIGRGSPTGVVFYEAGALPEPYQGTFLVCDWSMGRILAVKLTPDGASYVGEPLQMIAGNPLNVSDIEVAPDGAVLFTTGGRGTEGGIYRVSAIGQESKPFVARGFEDLLVAPQPSAAWYREQAAAVQRALGERWGSMLKDVALGDAPAVARIRALSLLSQFGPKPDVALLTLAATDEDAAVRGFATWLLGTTEIADPAQRAAVTAALTERLDDDAAFVARRACEAAIRAGVAVPVEKLVALLDSDERFLRYAARRTLSRQPLEEWPSLVLDADSPRIVVNGLLALYQAGALPHERALELELSLLRDASDADLLLDVLRMTELTLLEGGVGPATGEMGELLLERFPTEDPRVNAEIAKLLGALQVPGAAEKIVDVLQDTKQTQSQRITYALALRYLETGWGPLLRRELLTWYEGTKNWEGGHSFTPYLANIVAATVAGFTPEDRAEILRDYRDFPLSSRLILERTEPEGIADFETLLPRLIQQVEAAPDLVNQDAFIDAAIECVGRSASEQAQETLRSLYESQIDRREAIARQLANHPTAENLPLLLRTLRFGESATLQASLRGIAQSPGQLEGPAAIRDVILAGLKLGDAGGIAVNALRRKLAVRDGKGKDIAAALGFYRDWFAKEYPNQPPVELPKLDPNKSKYSVAQLVNFLEKDPRGQAGDVARGAELYKKTNCAKCHQFGKEGLSIGPDLSAVRRRLQKKEIIESIIHPSLIVSDQYRTYTVLTVDGELYSGLPLPRQETDKLVMLLPRGETIEIVRDDIEVQKPSPVSVMPAGLLNDLTLPQVADLFAYLETSRSAPLPKETATAGGAAGGE